MIIASALGVFLAVLFLAAMGALFHWMFSLPPMLPRQAVTVRRTVHALRRILVPVIETVPAERAVELASRLGEDQKAEIVLVYVITVPLTLPLNVQMPSQEAAGRNALNTAEALVRAHNLPVRSRMMPARNAADGILHIAEEEDSDVIVMGIGKQTRVIPEEISRIATEVLRRAPCEVIVDKMPPQA